MDMVWRAVVISKNGGQVQRSTFVRVKPDDYRPDLIASIRRNGVTFHCWITIKHAHNLPANWRSMDILAPRPLPPADHRSRLHYDPAWFDESINRVYVCEPRNGMLCRRNYPGISACKPHGGKMQCLRKKVS